MWKYSVKLHERGGDEALLVLATLLFLIVWISDPLLYLYCVLTFDWSINLTTLYSLVNCVTNFDAWVQLMLSATNKLLAKLFTCVFIIILVYWCYFVPETPVSNHYCWCYTHLLWLFTLSISHIVTGEIFMMASLENHTCSAQIQWDWFTTVIHSPDWIDRNIACHISKANRMDLTVWLFFSEFHH